MVALTLLVLCTLYFIYLKKWIEGLLSKEYNFGSPSPGKPIPHLAILSIIVGVLWGFLLLAGAGWGFTFNPYPEYMSVHGDKIEFILDFVLWIAIGLSYYLIYRMGEINGVEHMKNTQLFQTYVQTKNDA